MTQSRSLMIQGTASSSGKSLLTAGLCRVFAQDGLRVAPFKAQNMSNNSFVTREGLEMGRAQVVQALAAGLEPEVRMNPVLLKPGSDCKSQVVLRGRSAFDLEARHWRESRPRLREVVRECYTSLAKDYELIVLEGAGSPAEINLKQDDIVNMGMAAMAGAPVLLVGDIDRGGVFASLVGTMQLLEPEERARVKGFVINKFRGELSLLEPGLRRLEELTGVPVLGVLPWFEHVIDEEDAACEKLEASVDTKAVSAVERIEISIVRLPHVSNFTDFAPLEAHPGIRVRWCRRPSEMGRPDLLILPGTKSTISDLRAMREAGWERFIGKHLDAGGLLLGICGGFQMLGREILDPEQVESPLKKARGLGLLNMVTEFRPRKQTQQRTARFGLNCPALFESLAGTEISGYEIHMGQSTFGPGVRGFLSGQEEEASALGGCDEGGQVIGTYLHGCFDSASVVFAMYANLCSRKGISAKVFSDGDHREVLLRDLDRLAELCREQLDLDAIRRIALG